MDSVWVALYIWGPTSEERNASIQEDKQISRLQSTAISETPEIKKKINMYYLKDKHADNRKRAPP